MFQKSNYVRTICEIGIFAAVGFVLDELQGIISKGIFINGGSIGFAMLAVIVVGYRRGWLPAILTGLIMGGLDIATSAYILHPAQLLLDYILPYAVVGIGCLFKYFFDRTTEKKFKITWLLVGVLVGGLFKFLSHYLAGIIFWADPNNFAWGLTTMSPYLYCFIYNIAFIGPSIVLTGAIAVALFVAAPKVFVVEQAKIEKEKDNIKLYGYISSSVLLTGGLFCFIWYLIDYIKSFSHYVEENEEGIAVATGYDFNPDSMIIFVLGAFLVVLAILSVIKINKRRYSPFFATNVALIIVSSSFIYSLARLIRMYVKHKDPTLYWIWFAIGLVTVAIFAGISLYFYLKRRKETNAANQSA